MEWEYFYQVIYQIRTYFPQSPVLILFNLLLKSTGVYLFTHNIKGFEDNIMSIHHIFLQFLFRRYQSNRLFKTFSFVLFSVLLAYILLVIVSLICSLKMKQRRHKSTQSPKGELQLKQKKAYCYNISIAFCSIFLICMSLLSQHLIEILFAGISNIGGIFNDAELKSTEKPTMTSLIYQGVINIVTVLIIAFLYFIFMVLSIQKSEVASKGNKTNYSKSSFLFLFFCIFLQGLYSVTSMLQNDKKILAQLIINCIITVYLLFDGINNAKKSVINSSFISKCLYAIKLDCFFSGLIELLLFFALSTASISQKMSLFKQIIEFLFVVILFILTFNIWEAKQTKQFSQYILLETNSKITAEHLSIYYNLLKKYLSFDSTENFYSIFDIIHNHIIQCVNSSCPCQHVSSFDSKGGQMSKISKIEKLFKEMILIGEQEINNLIHSKSQENGYNDIEEICFLHIDYIALIKHDFIHSFYLTYNYYAHKSFKHKWSFFNRYFLYELKKVLLNSYVNNQKTIPNRLTSKKLHIASSITYLLLKEVISFYDYLMTIDNLHKCIFHCCDNLEAIVSYLSYTNIRKKTSSSYAILKLFRQNIELNSLLHSNFIISVFQKKYRSIEVNYLLSNYLILCYGEIPIESKNELSACFDYSVLKKRAPLYNQYAQEKNVVITSMDSHDACKITYASHSFCEHFQWKHESLINNDFNILLPHQLGVYHNTYMKLFSLFHNSSYSRASFILDESKYLHNVSFNAKKMINMSHGFNLIFTFTKKRIPAKKERTYRLMLDSNFNIMNMEQSFEKQFYFLLQMLLQLKINFAQLFAIDRQTLVAHFKKSLKAHKRSTSLNDIIKATTIYNTIANEKLFTCRGFDNFQLYYRTINLSQTITIKRNDFNEIVNRGLQMIYNMNVENNVTERIISSTNIFYNLNAKGKENEEMDMTFNLKNINSLYYYVILVKENLTLEESFPTLQIDMGLSENVSEEFSSPKISTIKRGGKLLLKPDFSPLSRDAGSCIAFLDSNQVGGDKSINNNNLKILNTSHQHLNKVDHRRKGIIMKKDKPEEEAPKEFHKLFDDKIENRSLFIVVLLMKILFIFNAAYYYYSFTLSSNIFYINYFSFVLKDDMTICSIHFVRNCLIADNANPFDSSSDLSSKFQMRNEFFLANINKALAYVNQLNSYDQLLPVFEVLYAEMSYKYLRDDWTESSYNSTLMEELHKMHASFFLITSADSFNTCGVDRYFQPNYKDSTRVPHLEEKMLYYINKNALKTLMTQLNKFSNTSLKIFQLIHEKAKSIYVLIYIITICFCLVLYLVILAILMQDKMRIKSSLIKIYIMENEDNNRLKKNLASLKTITTEFTKQNCEKYEESLKKKSYSLPELDKEKEKLINSLNQRENKEDINNAETSQLFRLSFENLKHYSNLTQIPLVNQVLIISTTLFLLNFCLHVTHFIKTKDKYDFISSQNDIGTNIIGRIPMFSQMLLYALASFIQNNPYNIPYKFKPASSVIPNYYNVSIDIETDSIYTVLNGTNYLLIYYKLATIEMTIESYQNDESQKDLFALSLNWKDLFNRKDYFPIAASIGFIQFYPQCASLTSCFALTNQYAVENVFGSTKLSLNGFDSLFNLMIRELNSLFTDFTTSYSKENDTKHLLFNKDLWIIIENTLRVLSMANDVFNYVTRNDIYLSYSKAQTEGLAFSLALIVFSILSMYTIIIALILKLRKTLWIIETVGENIIKLKHIHSMD